MMLTAYTPKSPMASAYLRANGITGLAIWRDVDNPRRFRLACTTDNDGTQGWPNDGPALLLRTCREQGRKLAERYGLTFHDLTN